MSKVIVDNWTLHNAANAIFFSDATQEKYKDYENLLLAILLWDEVYYWDNGKSGWWQSIFTDRYTLPLKSLTLPQQIAEKTELIDSGSIIENGALQYQMLAGELGMDYLAEQKRFMYMNSSSPPPNLKNTIWQRYCIDRIEEETQTYYKSLTNLAESADLKFRFPLLVDYLMGETNDIRQCFSAAMDMRNAAALCNMRKWISDLHKYIDRGNWIEIRQALKDVNDIVSDIVPTRRVEEADVQITFPLSIAFGIPFKKLTKYKPQLTFLRDLTKFALKSRPGE